MRVMLAVFALILTLTSTAAAQCVADAGQVIDHIYRQVLERPPDQESAGLHSALASGRISVRGAVAALAGSPEYEMRFFWPSIVAAVYEQVLERAPTRGELQDASIQLTQGAPVTSFVADVATRAVNNDPNAIRMLYRRLLRRDPDADGMRAYTEMAQQQGARAVAESIVGSPEYREKATANGIPLPATVYTEPVRGLYRHLLGRNADRAGIEALAELTSVYGLKGPIDRILNSPEYLQRFGENGLPGAEQVQFCGGERQAVPRARPGIRRRPN
jgi:hypothetical protein